MQKNSKNKTVLCMFGGPEVLDATTQIRESSPQNLVLLQKHQLPVKERYITILTSM